MPIYEYKCLNCKKEFSLLQSVGSSEKDTECSFCGSDSVKKKLSSFSCSASEMSDFAPASSSGVGGG